MMNAAEPTLRPSSRTIAGLIALVVLLTLINYLLLPAANITAHDLEGTLVSYERYRSASLTTLFVTVPIVGFLLGGGSTLLPIGSWSGWPKYVAASLVCMACLHSIFIAIRCGFVPV